MRLKVALRLKPLTRFVWKLKPAKDFRDVELVPHRDTQLFKRSIVDCVDPAVDVWRAAPGPGLTNDGRCADIVGLVDDV